MKACFFLFVVVFLCTPGYSRKKVRSKPDPELIARLKQHADSVALIAHNTVTFTINPSFRFRLSFDYLYHTADEDDLQYYKKYRYLIHQNPRKENYEIYSQLAQKLWNLNKTYDAEVVCLKIVRSREAFYCRTRYHSSDIPGDTTHNIYGYGSFTSNLKNYAAVCLTRIYIERKQYARALQFLKKAVTEYKVTYTCGTGYRQQKDEYDFLFAACYLGLGKNKDVIDLLLPGALTRDDTMIIHAIRRSYSRRQIAQHLKSAENSISFTPDTFASYSYRGVLDGETWKNTDTSRYFSGRATMDLFNRKINFPIPSLENGEHLKTERLVKEFRESSFYRWLKEGKPFG